MPDRPNMAGSLFKSQDNIPPHIKARYRDDNELEAIQAEEAAPPVKAEKSEKPEKRKRKRDDDDAPRYKRTTGSYGEPYVREDGVEMTKWGLHVPLTFVEQFKLFSGHLGLKETQSEFVVRAVLEKMKREMARRKSLGTWKSLEDLDNVG